MNKILQNHNQIIEKIKEILADTCKTNSEDIHFSKQIINNEILRFQFECTYMYSKIGKLIYLNFDIFYENPQIIEFESMSGPIKFDKTNTYKGLLKSIRESIIFQINNK